VKRLKRNAENFCNFWTQSQFFQFRGRP